MNTSILLQPETSLQTEQLHLIQRRIELSGNTHLYFTTGYATTQQSLAFLLPQLGESTVGFNFCLKGSASFVNKGKYSAAHADEQSLNHILFPRTETFCQMDVQGQFAQILFCIGKERYFEVLGNYSELQPSGFLHAAETPGHCFFNKNHWTPAFRQLATQTLQNQMDGLSGKLFFESKMLEVMALMLETYREKPIEPQKIKTADLDRMHHVRALLEQNLSHTPSLAHLARLAGTNEFALKKHFKETFGVPVFKYLQQLRLDRAHALFHSTPKLVGEVALEVGYESISAFSRAFKERFGVQPQHFRHAR